MPKRLEKVTLKACKIVGKQIYVEDFKEVDSDYVVVGVNDNLSIYGDHGDLRNTDLCQSIFYLSEL